MRKSLNGLSVIAAVAALGLAVSGCSGSTSDKDSAKKTTSSAAAPASTSAPASTPETSDAATGTATPSTEASSEPSSPAAGSGAAASPAPEGKKMKSGLAAKMPTQVGDWKRSRISGGMVTYANADDSKEISFAKPLTSSAQEMVKGGISKGAKRAGTGWCGSTEVGDTICYVDTADGTLNINPSTGEISSQEMFAFTNQLAQVVGTE